MDKLHIIYIPGIGDDARGLQSKIVKTWRWWGVEPELFSMEWSDKQAWNVKFNELLARIDAIVKQGHAVGLVGASAGATAIINAFAERPDIVGIVSVAGKINRPENIGQRYRHNNPSFIESAYQCKESLKKLDKNQRDRILSRYAFIDEVVNKRQDSMVDGAHNHVVPSIGHGVTIATQLLFGAPSFLRFLKKQQHSL